MMVVTEAVGANDAVAAAGLRIYPSVVARSLSSGVESTLSN